MARARNIKPGFFTNDELVEFPFDVRLLFIGLWTIADKEGRLIDRPKKIKMEIFPADNVDCDAGLAMLAKSNFIRRYSVDGVRYIQVVNWHKHQAPHHTEKASVIPKEQTVSHCSSSKIIDNGELTVNSPLQDGGNPPDSLIPDSLIPDSGFTDSPPAQAADEPPKPPEPPKREKSRASLKAADLIAEGVSDPVAADFIAHRKAKRAPLTATALDGIRREAGLAMITLEDALRTCLEQGWQGFRADWYANLRRATPGGYRAIGRGDDVTERNRQAIADAKVILFGEQRAVS